MEATPYLETFVMPAASASEPPPRRLLAVLEEMMEAAGRHAERLGVGVRQLHARGLTWVLARLHVMISSIPASGATVHIATWPAGRHRLFAVRDFQLSDGAGRELLRATSAWALMNTETRRPARLDPHLPVFSSHPERMVEDDFAPLPPAHPDSGRTAYRAAAADIDLNDHVNNTVYIDWALRSVPEGARAWNPLSLEAAFLGEARLGQEIDCLTAGEADERIDGVLALLQSLRDAASGRELTRLRTRWRTQGAGKTEGRMREE
ncbi:MAG: thioesterase [Acidobacteria bacterium]|jgi:acyl-ACP thioesterase|nr:thioesterase [Acidobacteriota bacterium]